MLQFNTIYGKIKTLLIVVGSIFLILFFILQFYKSRQDKQIISKSQEQFNHEINALLKLKSESYIFYLRDLTFWDDFVNCIETKDTNYFKMNIGAMVESFQINSVHVFNKNYEILFQAKKDNNPILVPIPKEAVISLNKTRFAHFFLASDAGIIEVIAASVHPSDDPDHKTEPAGYMFVEKLWDKQLLSELSTISGSKVEILNLTDSVTTQQKHKVYFKDTLTSWDGTPVSVIAFNRDLNLNLSATQNIMFIILAFVMLALLLSNLIARRCINKPLKLVTDILKTDNSESITNLKEAPAEYGRIGHLFEEYVHQKQDLKVAKDHAVKADKLKSEFLANISHEIRTPISHIIGFTGLLEDEENKDKRTEYFQIIKNSSSNLVNIIDDLIDLSKIEAGDLSIKNSEFDLNAQLKELKEIYLNEIKKKNKTQIVFECILPENECIINSDRQRIKQILSNLLSNSLKFTEQGTISFGYKIENNEIVFFVADTGIGIKEENKSSVFDHFIKFNHGDLNIGGTGIGLSIVQKIVIALKGRIWFTSTYGLGTNFFFSIPANIANVITNQANDVNTAKDKQTKPALTKKNILVVDDDMISLLLIKEILRPLDMEVSCVTSGEDAIDYLKKNPETAIILLDIRLPEMDGYEVTEKIRTFNKKIPIIAQTANALIGDKEKALKHGCNNYLSKPLDSKLLQEMVKMYLSEKEIVS